MDKKLVESSLAEKVMELEKGETGNYERKNHDSFYPKRVLKAGKRDRSPKAIDEVDEDLFNIHKVEIGTDRYGVEKLKKDGSPSPL